MCGLLGSHIPAFGWLANVSQVKNNIKIKRYFIFVSPWLVNIEVVYPLLTNPSIAIVKLFDISYNDGTILSDNILSLLRAT